MDSELVARVGVPAKFTDMGCFLMVDSAARGCGDPHSEANNVEFIIKFEK
jgi:hypothetical protein